MANIGTTLPEFGVPSALMDGPLKNCLIGWAGYMLGKTTEDTQLMYDDDVKEITYSQDGTKPADHVITGSVMKLTATFAEIKTSMLSLMKFGVTRQSGGGEAANLAFGRYTYTSLRQNKANVLRVYATDSSGTASTDDIDVANFYKAVPVIQENLINWGADTQTNFPVEFHIYYEKFDGVSYSQVSGGPAGSFGYFGAPADAKLPAASWPTVTAMPVLTSAEVTDSDTVTLTFGASVTEQTSAVAASVVLYINGVAAVGVALADTPGATQAIEFTGSTITSGDTVQISIRENVFEDTSTAAQFNGAVNFPVTNGL